MKSATNQAFLLFISVFIPALSLGCGVSGDTIPPGLAVSLPDSSFAVGSSVSGTVTLATASSSALQITLSTSAPTYLTVSPLVLVLKPGTSTASFTCTALAAGAVTLRAAAPGYLSAASQVTTFVPPSTIAPPATLRDAAAPLSFLIGAAADADEFGYKDPLVADPLYSSTLGNEYNMLEPEAAMKWNVLHPAQTTYDFQPGDELVAFAQAHRMKVRGHNLCWNLGNPDWLSALQAGPTSALYDALKNHITTVASHYKGQVFAWDVVNEAVDDNSTGVGTQLKDSIWYNQPGIGLSGTGYVEQAFRWARAADPDALLFYNDYNFYTPGAKFQGIYNMLADFVKRGVPIDGVGMQMHIDTLGYPDSDGLTKTMGAFTALGLQVHITEMDVALPVDAAGIATPGDLQAQAAAYQRILIICLENPRCTALETWGFSDAHSWIPAAHPGFGDALPFDDDYQPKAAYRSLVQTLGAVVATRNASAAHKPDQP